MQMRSTQKLPPFESGAAKNKGPFGASTVPGSCFCLGETEGLGELAWNCRHHCLTQQTPGLVLVLQS